MYVFPRPPVYFFLAEGEPKNFLPNKEKLFFTQPFVLFLR